ncbi:MAG: LPXTG cell wall anchor domain-containing protein [Bacteroidota bacterium]|nr:LPXTG cell wall anchor domain-containing protein [Bacteroidota bacterium]
MRQVPFMLSLLLFLASGRLANSNARGSLSPADQTTQTQTEVPGQTGSGNTAAIIAGAVAIVAIAGYFLLRKKNPQPPKEG